jgi:uncharacterized protein
VERALGREVAFIEHLAPRETALDLGAIRRALADDLAVHTDRDGGEGAPRFPRPAFVDALYATCEPAHRDAARRILRAMSRGGLFDHLEGGFARYSVDARWHVPHFEKMLSDQALLARCYFRAARRQDAEADTLDVARRSIDFVLREMNVKYGFAASLDADADGREGSHLTWTREEIGAALRGAGGANSVAAVAERLCVGPPGDLEGRSVPRLADDAPLPWPPDLTRELEALREVRRGRPQPGRDDKVILEWNAMFATALFASPDEADHRRALILLAQLGESHVGQSHWWRTQARRDYATAADLAWLIDAHVDAFEATGDDQWLDAAHAVAAYLLEHHWDGPVPRTRQPREGVGLFATSDLCGDLFRRPKEIFDGATPSSHAIATRALARLALCRADEELMVVAERLVELAAELLATHPRAVVDLVEAAAFTQGVEVVVPGEPNELSRAVRSLPVLRGVLITGSGSSPLLNGRRAGLAYVCHRGHCERPVATVEELTALLAGAV